MDRYNNNNNLKENAQLIKQAIQNNNGHGTAEYASKIMFNLFGALSPLVKEVSSVHNSEVGSVDAEVGSVSVGAAGDSDTDEEYEL